MNNLQQELNNINQQLEHLNARKAQLEPIIEEYNDTLNRVKNLAQSLIDFNIDISNLTYDIEDILEGNEPGDWAQFDDSLSDDEPTQPTEAPQPGQDFPTDWINATTEAHSQPEETENYCPVCRVQFHRQE